MKQILKSLTTAAAGMGALALVALPALETQAAEAKGGTPGAQVAQQTGAAVVSDIMKSPAGKIPFFLLSAGFSSVSHDRAIVLVRARPPFDELATFSGAGMYSGMTLSSKDDRFAYVLTPASYVVQIATATFQFRKIYTPGRYDGVVLSPNEKFLYAANFERGEIYKIDIATGLVVDEITYGQEETRVKGTYLVRAQGPSRGLGGDAGIGGLARSTSGGFMSPDGRFWYLTPESGNPDSQQFKTVHIWKFDLSKDEMVTHMDTGQPAGAHMSGLVTNDGKYLYTGDFTAKAITQIDTETMTLVEVYKDFTFANWHAIHPSPDGKFFYVPMDKGKSSYLAVFNTGRGIAENLAGYVGPFPRALDSPSKRGLHMVEFTPDGRYATVGNMYEEEVYLIDVAKQGIAKTLKAGGRYEGKAPNHNWFGTIHPILTPDGKYMALAVVYDATYEVYDVESGKRLYKGAVGGGETVSTSHYPKVWAPGYRYGQMLSPRTLPGPTPQDSIDLKAEKSQLIRPDRMPKE